MLASTLLFFKLILGIAPLANIYCIEKLFSSLLYAFNNGTAFNTSYYWSFALVSVNLTVFSLNSLNTVISQKMMYKFEEQLKSELLEKSVHIPYQMFESSSFQNRFMRATHSSSSIISTFDGFLLTIQTLISLVSITAYLININLLFALIIVIMIIPLIFIELKFGRNRYQLNVDLSENSRRMNYLENLLTNKTFLKEIKIGQKESYIIEIWRKLFRKNGNSHVNLEVNQLKFLFAAQVIVTLSFVFSTTLVINMISNNLLSIAMMTAVIQAVQNLQGVIPSFANSLANSYESSLSVEEYKKFIPLLANKTKSAISIDNIEQIEICNLNYSYPENSERVLNSINFKISNGEKVAIMGTNGSGKTTLIKCLTGLYETKNSILFNDDKLPIENINKKSLWSNLSILFQDFNKYEFSISQNILLNETEELSAKHYSFLQLVGLKSFIDNLPGKYETQLGSLFNRGVEFSGGQWQKLGLVRALKNDADLVILDEPTSAMDAESEHHIIKKVLKNLNESTIIYITHRVNVAKLADTIIYLKDGEITEIGSHDQLIINNGHYARLYEGQVENLIGEKGLQHV